MESRNAIFVIEAGKLNLKGHVTIYVVAAHCPRIGFSWTRRCEDECGLDSLLAGLPLVALPSVLLTSVPREPRPSSQIEMALYGVTVSRRPQRLPNRSVSPLSIALTSLSAAIRLYLLGKAPFQNRPPSLSKESRRR